MGAVETIAKAIEKLEQLRAASTDGPWWVSPHYGSEYAAIQAGEAEWVTAGANFVEEADLLIEDAVLISTLHRTIDAQLAILRAYQPIRSAPAFVLDLAEAILGGDQ